MQSKDRSGDARWARAGGAASLLLAAVLLATVAFRAAASSVTDTIGDSQDYLDDLVDHRGQAVAAGVVMMRMGRRWWWPALVGFAGAAAGLVGALRPAEDGLRYATLVQVAALALWMLLLSVRLLLIGADIEKESGAD